MFSQIARTFSSQGVLVEGTRYASAPRRKAKAAAETDGSSTAESFASIFDQAAAKLDLSKSAQADMAGSLQGKKPDGKPLGEDDKKQVEELAKRDREVHAHEAAHLASAGGTAKGGANFEYKTGPDGKNYAVGGHVNIDVSPVQGNPAATLAKAQKVLRAALAPSDPSGQDRSVAASAASMALEAQRELGKNNDQQGQTSRQMEAGKAYVRNPAAAGRAVNVFA